MTLVPFADYTELWRGVGRICVSITCGVCGTICTAYVWSLAGSGKRCPGCKNLHGSYGTGVENPLDSLP